MFKNIKYKYRRFRANYPIINGINFVHHQPKHGNLGDELCSPKHYFDFHDAKKDLTIIGGGVYIDSGANVCSRFGFERTNVVLWGTGFSLRDDNIFRQKAPLDYAAWGLRDLDKVSSYDHFLPCVSCLHPMLDTKNSSDGVLLFLNADHNVTAQEEIDDLKAISSSRGWKFLLNNCSEAEMKSALKASSHILTNSFHGSYWGLLSGRQVTILGYSSKFKSLLHGLGLCDDRFIEVRRGLSGICKILSDNLNLENNRITLKNSKAKLDEFRSINLDFANKIVKLRLVSSWELKTSNKTMP